jgi:hypothetical protein
MKDKTEIKKHLEKIKVELKEAKAAAASAKEDKKISQDDNFMSWEEYIHQREEDLFYYECLLEETDNSSRY